MHQELEESRAKKGARWEIVRHPSPVTAQAQAGTSRFSAGDPATSIRMRSLGYQRLAAPRIGDFAVAEALVATGAIARKQRSATRELNEAGE